MHLINKIYKNELILIITTIFNYIWSIIKIILSIFINGYLYLLSAFSTLFIGINKNIYLVRKKYENKYLISFIISFFLILIGIFYLTYSVTLLNKINENKGYSMILAITIALFSFIELGISIYQLYKSKGKNHLVNTSFRIMNLSISLFSLVNTQSSIFMALNKVNNKANGSFGILVGSITILLGLYLVIKIIRSKKVRE